jgi:hypothetical protein
MRAGATDGAEHCCHQGKRAFHAWFEQVYTATHLIYVLTGYRFSVGHFVDAALVAPEVALLLEAVGVGVCIGNADLVGECLDTLHMCGLRDHDDPRMQKGVCFLHRTQDAYGAWSSRHLCVKYTLPDRDQHHATFVVLWALLCTPSHAPLSTPATSPLSAEDLPLPLPASCLADAPFAYTYGPASSVTHAVDCEHYSQPPTTPEGGTGRTGPLGYFVCD